MANYNNLKATINANIKANGNEEITGPILNTVLNQAVTTLGDGWSYKGIATPSMSPGTPDSNVFYIATTAGTYTNFGSLVVAEGEVAILKYNGSWAKEVTGAATAAQVTQLGQKLTSSVAYNENIEGKFIYPSGVIGDSDSFYILSCSLKVGYIYRIHVESKIGSTLSIAAIFNGEISTVNFISSLGSNIEDNKIHVYDINYICKNQNEILGITQYRNINGHSSFCFVQEIKDTIITSVEDAINSVEGVVSSMGDVVYSGEITELNIIDGKYISNKHRITELSVFKISYFKPKVGHNYVISINYRSGGVQDVVAEYTDSVSDENFNKSILQNIGDNIMHSYRVEYRTNSDNAVLAFTSFKTQGSLHIFEETFISDDAAEISEINARLTTVETKLTSAIESSSFSVMDNSLITDSGVIGTNNDYKLVYHQIKKDFKYFIHLKYRSGGTQTIASIYQNEVSNGNLVKTLRKNPAEDVDYVYDIEYECDIDNAILVLCQHKTTLDYFYVREVSFEQSTFPLTKSQAVEVRKQTNVSTNVVWSMMSKVNDKVSSLYGQHFIPAIYCANSRYDFGNIKVANDFIVPNLGESVTIYVDSNPQYTHGYSQEQFDFLVEGINICVGTKDVYDTYRITSINGNMLTCTLLNCETGLIGSTFKAYQSYVNESYPTVIANNYARVFREDDIISYNSDILGYTFTIDNVHPSTQNYLLVGKILAERISLLFSDVNRVIVFGDSWAAGSQGFSLDVFLDCSIVKKGESSDRVEHIIDRFVNYMENDYVEQSGDVFVFLMGTNNLLQALTPHSDKNIDLYNKSYVSIFLDACGLICEKLPKGNFVISQGFAHTLFI